MSIRIFDVIIILGHISWPHIRPTLTHVHVRVHIILNVHLNVIVIGDTLQVFELRNLKRFFVPLFSINLIMQNKPNLENTSQANGYKIKNSKYPKNQNKEEIHRTTRDWNLKIINSCDRVSVEVVQLNLSRVPYFLFQYKIFILCY